MGKELQKEEAFFRKIDVLRGMEVLRATYFTHTFARHAHETFAIGFIEAGAGAFVTRGTTHIAHTSNVFILHPGEVHNGYAASSIGWTYRMLYPEAECFEYLTSQGGKSAQKMPFFPSNIINDGYLTNLLITFHALLEQSSERLERETVFLQILTYLVSFHASHPAQQLLVGKEHQAVGWIRDYLHVHYDQPISLEQLASLVQLHPDYLIRAFHAHVGLPPHMYLTQVRIHKAKTLLLQNVPLARVAFETGFADQSHLTRHFKRIVGVSPGAYSYQVRNVQDSHS